ncbi:Elongator complex protein 5 [Microdochium trichocladiopsis]|uniref:Elongator complex protein 5 n=1 Tax=Microdochium trichocladiopsis TaxID=1682393 RepID=A0A9P9BVH3_9PEZI|nr:Elongator complex protein 5 [Microdochium trichocladiopsis]KAH7033342.1 Elongator complex protein 5 [Microdochium trichocladiopsis]
MPPVAQSHARSHALLLLQKLLNLRDNASPLTLVLDTLEQSGKPVVREFLLRAKIAKSKTIFVSFESLRKPAHADVLVKARGKSPEALCAEIVSHYGATPAAAGADGAGENKILVVMDTLNPLSAAYSSSLSAILGSLLRTPAVSIVGVYHTDVPLSPSSSSFSPESHYYEPQPLAVLTHLATAVLTPSSLHQALERKRARDRSLQAPEWGIHEAREGVLVGLRPRRHHHHYHHQSAGAERGPQDEAGLRSSRQGGLVLDMELRRRSGRSVSERFVFVPGASTSASTSTLTNKSDGTTPGITPPSTRGNDNNATSLLLSAAGKIMLLADHPLFTTRAGGEGGLDGGGGGETGAADEQPESTFNLGLTEKQRRDREGIVLPYFDAQTDIGAGEGGRILYEMGREDDFDDEEDEI